MDALRTAAPLARALFALTESGREGELVVIQRARVATLRIAQGRLYQVQGVDVPPLGDALRALGALDLARIPLESAKPIGARLVEAGATSTSSVIDALSLQLIQALSSLLRWPTSQLSFRDTPVSARGAKLDLTSTLWSALLALVATLPDTQLEHLAGNEPLTLTAAGTRRMRALGNALDNGALTRSRAQRRALGDHDALDVSPAALTRALSAHCPASELGLRALLRVLGMTAARPEPDDAYALLLRKKRELSRNASPETLLDLPNTANPQQARKALRKLAQKLHPDRFQASDQHLHALSQRVMGALTRAESSLRS